MALISDFSRKDPFLGKSKSTDSGHEHYGGRDTHCGPYTGKHIPSLIFKMRYLTVLQISLQNHLKPYRGYREVGVRMLCGTGTHRCVWSAHTRTYTPWAFILS